jgi:hypothetical protein
MSYSWSLLEMEEVHEVRMAGMMQGYVRHLVLLMVVTVTQFDLLTLFDFFAVFIFFFVCLETDGSLLSIQHRIRLC